MVDWLNFQKLLQNMAMTWQIFTDFFKSEMAEISAMDRAKILYRGVMKVAEHDFEVVTEVGGLSLED